MSQPAVRRESHAIADRILAGLLLIITSPLFILAACGIKMSGPGPIFYKASRMGRDRRVLDGQLPKARPDGERRRPAYIGREFTLYKFRTMRVAPDGGAPITAFGDARVFPFGSFLRATKIDELPQLLNVVKGEMSFVGPRPEAPEIVRQWYSPEDLMTLQVLPGLTSPGSLYYYTHCEAKLTTEDPTKTYTEEILPMKLAIDRVYLEEATLWYDLRIIIRTVVIVAARAAGWTRFSDPPELANVRS